MKEEQKIDIILNDLDPQLDGPEKVHVGGPILSVVRQGQVICGDIDIRFMACLEGDGSTGTVWHKNGAMIIGGVITDIGFLELNKQGEWVNMFTGEDAHEVIFRENSAALDMDLLVVFLEELGRMDSYIKNKTFIKRRSLLGRCGNFGKWSEKRMQ